MDHGPLHIVVFSTEHDFSPGSEQYKSLEQDLAGVDRAATPWVVVAGHRPVYALSKQYGWVEADQDVARDLRRDLEPLFLEHRVDTVRTGMNSERTRPGIGLFQPHCQKFAGAFLTVLVPFCFLSCLFVEVFVSNSNVAAGRRSRRADSTNLDALPA